MNQFAVLHVHMDAHVIYKFKCTLWTNSSHIQTSTNFSAREL